MLHNYTKNVCKTVYLHTYMQEFYIYFIRLWECEIFSDRRLIYNFPIRLGKDEHRTTSCESCKQPVP